MAVDFVHDFGKQRQVGGDIPGINADSDFLCHLLFAKAQDQRFQQAHW